MDEQNENGVDQELEEQNQEQAQAQQNMANTANAIKDSASLAKNVATGNVLGVAKDATKLAMNKKVRRRMIMGMVRKILTPFIVIIILGMILYAIYNAVAGKFQDLIDGVTDFFTKDDAYYEEGIIKIKDDDIDKIIESIKNMNVDMDGLKLMGDKADYNDPNVEQKNKEALRKYIRKFYEAQAVTETLYPKPGAIEQLLTDKVYGRVFIWRTDKDDVDLSKRYRVGYMKLEEMQELAKNPTKENAEKIKKYYSVDRQTEQLVVPAIRETTVEVLGDGAKPPITTYQITLQSIDYKSAIAQYTTQMNFFVCLTLVSQNPEFASAVADMAKLSDIQITLMDEVTKNVTTEIYTYTLNQKKKVEYISQMTGELVETIDTNSTPKKTTTITTIIDTIPKPAVTYAKTWFSEQKVNYNKKERVPTQNQYDTTIPNEPEPEPEGTWLTNQAIHTTIDVTGTVYEEGTREKVKIIIGDKGSTGLQNGKVTEKSTLLGLMDEKFKIPNTDKKVHAGPNLISGAQILFELLNNDAKLENMELIMREALNRYTNSTKFGEVDFTQLEDYLDIRPIFVGIDYIVDTRQTDAEQIISTSKRLKETIEKLYSGQIKTNLSLQADAFIAMQNKYNVNAVFAVAVTIIESSGGTNWAAIDPSTYNWMSVMGSYNGNSQTSSNGYTWKKYSNFREATMDFGALISENGPYFRDGRYTVKDIAEKYCNTDWGVKVCAEMAKIYEAAGIKVPDPNKKPGDNTNPGGTLPDYNVGAGGVLDDEAMEALNAMYASWISNGTEPHWWHINPNIQRLQCVWWIYGRASQFLDQNGIMNRYPPPTETRNAKDYLSDNIKHGYFKSGTVPKPNSIAVWTDGEYGHVAYVEGVTSDGIYVSHAGNGTDWYGVTKLDKNGNVWNYGPPDGYIYLDEPLK